MNRYARTLAGIVTLLALTGCSNFQMPHFGAQQPAQASAQPQPASSGYANQTFASNTGDCRALASQRAAMFNRPDVYPTSPAQQQEAYQALYTQCVNGNTPQVAAASHNNVPYNVASAANFANLSPAAGGNPPYPAGNAVSAGGAYVASGANGATVVVVGGNGNKDIAAQLSSLSPASGGTPSTNPTVVYVQAPNAAPASGYYAATPTPSYYRPTTPLPVAVPIPPQAQGNFPAPQAAAAMPQPTMAPQRPSQNPVMASAAPAPALTTAPHHPSLAPAGANATGTGTTSSASASDAASQQLENVLEK